MDDATIVLRTSPVQAQAEEWSLVLEASGVAHGLRWGDGAWALVVLATDAERAAALLAADDAEHAAAEPAPGAREVPGGVWFGGFTAALLILFFVVTGGRDAASGWFVAGSAAAERIVAGEWWRTVTALTLHADLGHIAGNAAACLIFFTAVASQLGAGVSAWALLLAGAAGNATTALIHRTGFVSVGASTSLFAAIGLLTVLAIARAGRPRHRGWVGLAAGLALLGLLGTGKNADLLAHLFGFVAGTVVALPFARRGWQAPRRLVQWQWLLAASALLAIIACWVLALRAAGLPR